MRLLLATIILTFLTQPAWASLRIETAQLYQTCKSWEQVGFSAGIYADQTDQGVCLGYMDAWASTLRERCYLGVGGGADLSREQLAQAFMNFAGAHPELWEYTPTSLGSLFLTKFPCKQ